MSLSLSSPSLRLMLISDLDELEGQELGEYAPLIIMIEK
jgi:hypothetical protein